MLLSACIQLKIACNKHVACSIFPVGWFYDMEPNTLIYEFKVTYRKILHIIDTIFIIINIIKFQGLVSRQPYLCKKYLVC